MASLNNFNLDEVRVKEPIIGLKMCLTKELAIRLTIMSIKEVLVVYKSISAS